MTSAGQAVSGWFTHGKDFARGLAGNGCFLLFAQIGTVPA
jgi:hypothetical protein